MTTENSSWKKVIKLQYPDGTLVSLGPLELRAAQMHYHLVGGDPIELIKLYQNKARKFTPEELDSIRKAGLARRDKVQELKKRILLGQEKIYERRALIDITPEGPKKQSYQQGLHNAGEKLAELCDELTFLGYRECLLHPAPGTQSRLDGKDITGFIPPCEKEEEMEKPCLVCPRPKKEEDIERKGT